jgi:uncharacterized damage-inducible protein DinB
MRTPILHDAFAHHVWATLRVIDTCATLSPEQLAFAAPGTYGSILETMRHLVDSDLYYLGAIAPSRGWRADPLTMELEELRDTMERLGEAWGWLLAQDLEADAEIEELDESGFERRAPLGLRLAQALHHGTDHRSQICTALSVLEVAPPDIDVWDFGRQHGRVDEVLPPS